MKKLKRYQYERYAILCQLAYSSPCSARQQILDSFEQTHILDNRDRLSVRLLFKENKKEVIVVFRGSIHWRDWLGNMCFFPVKWTLGNQAYYVHWGFKRMLEQPMVCRLNNLELALPLIEILEAICIPMVEQGKKLTFIGHSSGGAIATLTADYFAKTFPQSMKRVVTFGAPAICTRSFKQHYALHKCTYRICCDLDIVTFMPLIPWLYWHVGKMLWLHDDAIFENTPTMKRLAISLKSWLLRPITYHYMRKYIRNKTLFDKH